MKWRNHIMGRISELSNPSKALNVLKGKELEPNEAGTAAEKDELEVWQNLDLKVQGFIRKSVDEDLLGVLEEADTATQMYSSVLEIIRRQAAASIIEAEERMRRITQLSEKGDYTPLEVYLQIKQEALNDWSALHPASAKEQVTDEVRVFWMNRGLAEDRLLEFKIKYLDRTDCVGVNQHVYLRELRKYNNARLNGRPDGDVAMKGFQGKATDSATKFKEKHKGACFHCGKTGHYKRDCRSKCTKSNCKKCGERQERTKESNTDEKKSGGQKVVWQKPIKQVLAHTKRF
jgi:hypothetical protein